jgi:hypothetical protein
VRAAVNEVRVEATSAESRVSQSIVVRLWLEEPEPAHERAIWRGRVTHVPSGEECTVDSLAGIAYVCAIRLLAVNALLRWYERLWVRVMSVKR